MLYPEPLPDHPHVRSTAGRWVLPTAPGSWGVRRAVNGSIQVIWQCAGCEYRSTPVPHPVFARTGLDIRNLPILVDRVGHFARCIVRGCEADDVELNHFGPQGVFGDAADDWPTGFLCVRHHREWGERVTPHLNRAAQ